MWKLVILKWNKYNKLTIIEEIFWKNRRYFNCKCECWVEKIIALDNIISWKSKSCWCYRKEKSTERFITHWMRNTRFYNIFAKIKQRCNNSNDTSYKNYWLRWIKCEWNSFEKFREDMYESYLEHCKIYWIKNTTIDRKDNNLNYRKSNCKWGTYGLQARNRKNVFLYKHNWKSMCIKDWCLELWLKYNTVRSKIYKNKLTIKEALRL